MRADLLTALMTIATPTPIPTSDCVLTTKQASYAEALAEIETLKKQAANKENQAQACWHAKQVAVNECEAKLLEYGSAFAAISRAVHAIDNKGDNTPWHDVVGRINWIALVHEAVVDQGHKADSQIDQFKKELEREREQLLLCQKGKDELTEDRARLLAERAIFTRDIANVNRENTRLANNCSKIEAERDKALAELAEERGRMDEQRTKYARLLHAAKNTCELLVMPRVDSQDVCGLRELRDAVVAHGVELDI